MAFMLGAAIGGAAKRASEIFKEEAEAAAAGCTAGWARSADDEPTRGAWVYSVDVLCLRWTRSST